MATWLLCLSFLLLAASITAQTQTCPTDWLKNQDKCYRFVAYPRLNLVAANRACQDDGAALVSVNTLVEHQFIARWLLTYDQRRATWLTSGVNDKATVTWQGDGSTVTVLNKWIIPPEIYNTTSGQRVLYGYSGAEYGWILGTESAASSYICEISIEETYRIVQEFRDFTYGLDLTNPSEAPRGPTFLTTPEDTTVFGYPTSVYLECLASGNPEPTYQWYKQINGVTMVPITKSDKYSFTTGRLEIINPNVQDESIYQCKATNEYGSILSSSSRLTFGSLGEFSNVAPESVTGYEFKGAQLECPDINGKPAKIYNWFKNSYQTFVRPNADSHIFISTNRKLYFSELTDADAGTYFCMVSLTDYGGSGNYIGASQPDSRTSLGFDLIVKSGGGKEFPPIIQDEFIYVFPPVPTKGGVVRLECFAYGTKVLTYSWSRANNKPLPRGHSMDSHNRILLLRNVELEDGGTYICRVHSSSRDITVSTSVDLTITSKPYFTYELAHQHLDAGARLTWHCEASGQPQPTYQWYKNGEIFRGTTGVTISRNTLTIDSVDGDRDSAMYQCAAKNDYGTSFSTAQLRVLELAPSFKKNPMVNTMSGAEMGRVTIVCDPTAAPKPTFQWFKDGSNLNLQQGVYNEEDRYQFLQNGNLVINSILASDQGRYTCRVENSLGQAEDDTNLIVLKSTTISQAPIDDRVEVNLTATMLCRASHSAEIDMVYQWSFNGYPIDYEVKPEYRKGEGAQKGSLYIIATRFEHEGWYKCTATTGLDQISASAYLTVMGPPGEPAGVNVQQSTNIEGSGVSDQGTVINRNTTRWLVWTDGLDHFAPITHYFIEFRTNFDQRWRVHPDGNNIPKYTTINEQYGEKRFARLTNLKAGAGVQFRVKARNGFGIGPGSLPTTMIQIPGAKPTAVVKNVRGGGGSVGDLTIVWDPLPIEDHNGKNLKYKIYTRLYESNTDTVWEEHTIENSKACKNETNYIVGQFFRCQYVHFVGPRNSYVPYEVAILASNEYGDGPRTQIQRVMSAENLPIGTPENVYAKTYNATALLVTWKPAPNTEEAMNGKLKGYKINYWRYKIEEETSALQNIIALKEGQDNLSEGLIIGLEPVTWYRFNVQAYNSAGNGPKSSNYEQQTLNRVPSQYPTEIHVYSVEGFGVRVNFRGISTQIREEPLQGYKVQYWNSRENILNARIADFGKMTTGVIRNLTSSTLYELRVYGYSRAGQGKRSSPTVHFTVGEGQIVINPATQEMLGAASVPTLFNWAFVLTAAVTLVLRY